MPHVQNKVFLRRHPTMPSLMPERRRWIILALIFAAFALNYFDRQIVSILKPTLKAEFQIDDAGYARLINVFQGCYAAMYPVAGWIVDRFGACSIMLLGIVGWSLACLGAGFTQSLGQLTVFRGLLGMAEPLAFPAQLRVVAVWFSGKLRATANSCCVAGTSIGAITAPPLVAWLTLKFGWHAAFAVPAVIGLLVAALWWLFYRDPPAEFATAAAADTPAPGRKFSWAQLWTTRSLWGILLCRFISDPVWYFCLFWLPGYLQERSGLTLQQIGMVGWIPFLAADLSAIGTAAWSDRLVRGGQSPLRARKLMLTAVALLAPICALTPHLPQAAVTLIIFSIVGAVCLSWLFSMSVVIAETFPQGNVGSVLGIAGGCGAVGGMVFNHYLGQMIGSIGAAKMFLLMAVLHPLAALVLWTMVRRENPAAKDPSTLNPQLI